MTKSIVQQFEDAKNVKAFWEAMMPKREAPPMERILIWVSIFPEDAIQRGIRRAATKLFRTQGGMTADDCYRYASSVMRRMAEGQGVTTWQ